MRYRVLVTSEFYVEAYDEDEAYEMAREQVEEEYPQCIEWEMEED